jgi:hypothetical protein
MQDRLMRERHAHTSSLQQAISHEWHVKGLQPSVSGNMPVPEQERQQLLWVCDQRLDQLPVGDLRRI